MPSYIFRNIDPALWARVKAQAALEGVSVKTFVERVLAEFLRHPSASRK